MKKIIYIIIACLLPAITFGQSDFDYTDPAQEGEEPETSVQDSTAKNSDIKHYRMTWTWEHEGVYPKIIPLDTIFDGIYNYNYIFKKNISNTYLGNFPSPYESNIFITRETMEDFYPLSTVRAYLFKPADALLFNTTTPFTRLQYFNGGGRGKSENFLDIWHTQNIRPYWNAGIRYNLISSDGRYMNQKSKSYNFSFFSSFEKERLAISLFLNQNVAHFNENGGIKDRSFVLDSTDQQAENIPINLTGSNASNNVRNFNFYTQLQYNIGNKKPIPVADADTSYTYPAKAVLAFTMEDNEHWYKETTPNLEFFRHTYMDSVKTYDLVGNKIYNVSGKLVVNEHPKYKYLPGIYAGLDFKYEKYNQRTAYDSVTRTESFGTDKYMGTYITGGIFNVDTNASFNYDIAGSLCVVGHYAGNFKISGFLEQALKKDKSSYLRADALLELRSVDPFFTRYVGNHDMWVNDFKAEKTLKIEGKYINTRLRTEIGAGVSNIFSYVYFDTTAMPVQTGKTLTVFTAWVKEVFKAGNFYFDQNVYIQKNTHEDVLSLPLVSVYSHNYYKNYLFKRALQLQIGFDLFYHTKFYSDNYQPSIMQFYNQRMSKTGNYPKFDVFLSLRIKRADIFAKYEHLNYVLKKNGNYFSAYNYPINPAVFKFGIKWDFFD